MACGGGIDAGLAAPDAADAAAPGDAPREVLAPGDARPDAPADGHGAADGAADAEVIAPSDASTFLDASGSLDASSDGEPPGDAADATGDASFTDAACTNVCLVGDSTCEDGGLASCERGADGCNAWSAAASCGASAVCEARAYRASCSCQPGAALVDGSCAVAIGAPRPIAPLSTATVTSQSPTLHWALAPATDGAQVDVCRDRACATLVTTFAASGASGAPPAALAAGVYFWRLRGTASGAVGSQASPVWEFNVGSRSAPADTSWGTAPDIDGDGFADVVVGTVNASEGWDIDVYRGGSGGLATTPTVLHGPGTGFGNFGLTEVSVASAGDVDGDGYADVVMAGFSFNGNADVGTAFVYRGGPNGLVDNPTNILLQGVDDYGGAHPIAVASAGDVNGDGYADILTSAAWDADAVYVFLGGPGGPSTSPITLRGPASTDFGTAVAGAGDLNGDGYADVVVAADPDPQGPGAYVYLGGPSGPSSAPIPLAQGGSVACAGDVDGDGLADLLVGSSLFFGDASGVGASPAVLALPAAASQEEFVASVASAGDVNGDGFADLVVGAEGYDEDAGHAYVYLGGPSGPSATPLPLAGTNGFGDAVSGAGDVNGDGFADVLVGASRQAQGAVYLYYGAVGFSTTPVLITGFTGYTFASVDVPVVRSPG
jgi:hypothetical protein